MKKDARQIATFRAEAPTWLRDGDQLVLEREGEVTVARPVEPIRAGRTYRSASELLAAVQVRLRRRG